nr:uncharacterized protein LOC104845531 isoform X7 [Loxodonta africana]
MRWVLKRRHDLQPGAEDPATPRRQSFCKPSRCGASDAPSVCRPAGTPFPSTHRDVAWLLPWRSRGAAFAVGGLTMRTTLPTRRCVMSPHQSIANEGPGEGAFLCLRAGGDVTSGLALRFFLWMFECLSYSTGVFRSLSWRNIQTAVGLSGQDLGDESSRVKSGATGFVSDQGRHLQTRGRTRTPKVVHVEGKIRRHHWDRMVLKN